MAKKEVINIEVEIKPRAQKLNELLMSKRSEAHEIKSGKKQKRSRSKRQLHRELRAAGF